MHFGKIPLFLGLSAIAACGETPENQPDLKQTALECFVDDETLEENRVAAEGIEPTLACAVDFYRRLLSEKMGYGTSSGEGSTIQSEVVDSAIVCQKKSDLEESGCAQISEVTHCEALTAIADAEVGIAPGEHIVTEEDGSQSGTFSQCVASENMFEHSCAISVKHNIEGAWDRIFYTQVEGGSGVILNNCHAGEDPWQRLFE